jgi:hypothetical protein
MVSIGTQTFGMLTYWSVSACLVTAVWFVPKRVWTAAWILLAALWILGFGLSMQATLIWEMWFSIAVYALFFWFWFTVNVVLAWLLGRWATRRGRSAWRWGTAVFAVALAFEVWWMLFDNELPSDEEMIAHFEAHRGEFEELVALYRNYRPLPGERRTWEELPEIKVRRERVGVIYISTIGSLLWLPNPYSIESGKRSWAMNNLAECRRYCALIFEPSERRRYYRTSIRYGTIYKNYVSFPETPRVEQGRIWYPMDDNGVIQPMDRVADSLNAYPPNWGRGNCVYRRIEPKWYLMMCRTY